MEDAVLCYVTGNFAYFTTQLLSEQWGDDWNDAPYEHNAGTPYHDWEGEQGEGPRWIVSKVAFDGPFETPDYGKINSSYSVEQINDGRVPWLCDVWRQDIEPIYAGVTLIEFIRLIHAAGGNVYAAVPKA